MSPIPIVLLSTAAAVTPTPRPTPMVISDANLAALAAQGRFANPVAESADDHAPPALDLAAIEATAAEHARRRAEWRARLAAQLGEIHRLENQLEDQRVTAGWLWIRYLRTEKESTRELKVRPKMEAAQRRLGELEEELATARTRFDELCEEARRDGAEPGWFRGLEPPPP